MAVETFICGISETEGGQAWAQDLAQQGCKIRRQEKDCLMGPVSVKNHAKRVSLAVLVGATLQSRWRAARTEVETFKSENTFVLILVGSQKEKESLMARKIHPNWFFPLEVPKETREGLVKKVIDIIRLTGLSERHGSKEAVVAEE